MFEQKIRHIFIVRYWPVICRLKSVFVPFVRYYKMVCPGLQHKVQSAAWYHPKSEIKDTRDPKHTVLNSIDYNKQFMILEE